MTSLPTLVVSGASGLIGTHLARAATGRYTLKLLTRNPDRAARPGEDGARWALWNPEAASRGDERALAELTQAVSGAYALVNLAGTSIAAGRLGAAHQRSILESRLQSARALLGAQRRAEQPAQVWLQPSGINYYGDQGDTLLSETAPPGQDPLSDICRAWEAAPEDAGGAQLVVGRFGLVLAPEAETWQKLLLPIKLFVGGPLGSGQQWFSWIDADDLAQAILFLLEQRSASGVYNLTAPEPVRQLELTRQTAAKLSRPAVLPAPAFALRLALGGLADALILSSLRVIPARLQAAGFVFKRPTFAAELEHLL